MHHTTTPTEALLARIWVGMVIGVLTCLAWQAHPEVQDWVWARTITLTQ